MRNAAVANEPSEPDDSKKSPPGGIDRDELQRPLPGLYGFDFGKTSLAESFLGLGEAYAESIRESDIVPIVEHKVEAMNRRAKIERRTAETDIALDLALDGTGYVEINTGVGFFDHMLTHLGRHGLFDFTVRASGDTHIDDHHTVEDVGIAFGQALAEALDEKLGIQRYGSCSLPMDETLVTVAVDLSGRPCTVFKADFPTEKIGTFDCQLVEEFWRAAANNAKMTLHVVLHHGANSHHIAEAIFKAAARALRDAVAINERIANEVPSTKGIL
jgi:imidazoleglycerol-phosphate dehydratase